MGDNVGQQVLAVMGLLACLGVWAGMALGPARLQKLQARAQAAWQALRLRLRSPAQARRARQEAAQAIERARRAPKVDRQGNVYRPDSFKAGRDTRDGRDGRDKLH